MVRITSDNLFRVWRRVGKQTPFIARRNGWFHMSYRVTRVIPKGQYGEAFGVILQDGVVDGDGAEVPIKNAGCGNWELIESLIDDASLSKWNCLGDDNKLLFGKYKGRFINEVQELDPDYMTWAFDEVDGLRELYFTRENRVSLEELHQIKKQIKEKLEFSAHEWIKSSVEFDYEAILDYYKRRVYLEELSVQEAAQEMTNYYQSHNYGGK